MSRQRIAAIRARIEAALAHHLPAEPTANNTTLAPGLIAAMRYSTLAGGKRLRPLLCCAAAQASADNPKPEYAAAALATGCAIEFIHTYSLIHDDLPAMDDDSLRRGLPTCHIRHGEADAILAGDALQALAFEILAETELPAQVRLQMISTLSKAAGWEGMVGGQSFDLALTDAGSVTRAQLETLHAAKTGALLQASIELGARCAQPTDPAAIVTSRRIGAQLGLAFQVIDDVLDVSQTSATLGKDAGSDAAQGKTTFVNLLGEVGARGYAQELFAEALEEMATLPGETELLESAAREVVFRDR